MAELNVDAPLEGVTPEQAQTELAQIRGDKSNPYWQDEGSSIGGNPLAKKWHDRAEKLYSIAYPESDTRRAETEPNKSLHDTIKKTGLESVDQIKAEGQQGRQDVEDERVYQETLKVEGALRERWGNENFEKNLDEAKAIFNSFGGDKEWLNTPAPDGTRPGNDPELIDRILWIGRYISTHNAKLTKGVK